MSLLCSSFHLGGGSKLPWEQAICQVDYHQAAVRDSGIFEKEREPFVTCIEVFEGFSEEGARLEGRFDLALSPWYSLQITKGNVTLQH